MVWRLLFAVYSLQLVFFVIAWLEEGNEHDGSNYNLLFFYGSIKALCFRNDTIRNMEPLMN